VNKAVILREFGEIFEKVLMSSFLDSPLHVREKIIKLFRLCRMPAIVISIHDFYLFMEELALTVML
jgi:hypothetical protein